MGDMKQALIVLKLLTASIVFMITLIVFMLITSSYLPRLGGSNYYHMGCMHGISSLRMEIGVNKTKEEQVLAAQQHCKMSTTKLNKTGYLF